MYGEEGGAEEKERVTDMSIQETAGTGTNAGGRRYILLAVLKEALHSDREWL